MEKRKSMDEDTRRRSAVLKDKNIKNCNIYIGQEEEMKELEIVIKPEKLENLKRILDLEGARGVMITTILGYAHQKGAGQVYTRDETPGINLLHKLSVRTVVKDEIVENIVNKVLEELNTNSFGDGKIFIKEVADAVKVRTGERGDEAL